jgi:2-polyprenyl-3-methyl-5-hydroxy-6-metoxy-1,4-benzoquinol methylase
LGRIVAVLQRRLRPVYQHHAVGAFEAVVAEARAAGEFRHIKITPGLKVLDVGCGGGAFLRVVRELGGEVAGVEPSEHGAKAARAQGLPVFHGQLHDYINSGAADRRFDVVTASHVLEHHPEPVEMLKQMKSLLGPSGYVWFAVPNIASETAAVLKERWHGVDAPFHLTHFTPKAALAAVDRAGLRPRRQYTSSVPAVTFLALCDIWRHRYFAPRKLTQKIGFLRGVAERRSKAMDAAGLGEAIVVEATP